MRYRENYRNKSVEAMQAGIRLDREKPPIGPRVMEATSAPKPWNTTVFIGATVLVYLFWGTLVVVAFLGAWWWG